jgi:hypothetical protein
MTTTRSLGPRARLLLPAAGLVLLTASCGVRQAATGPAQPPGSTVLLSGVVQASPSCPVERQGHPCKPRLVGNVRVEARSLPAGVTTSTRTSADGRYFLRLRRGRYVLVAITGQTFPICPHVHIFVNSLAPVRADINCDSGIR